MKKYLLLITLVPLGNLYAQHFTLNGTLKGATPMLKLYYTGSDGKQHQDSIRVKDGKFSFHGDINEPTMGWLTSGSQSGRDNNHNTTIWLEPTSMTIDLPAADYKKAVVKGSVTQEEYQQLEAEKAPIYKEMEPLSKQYEKAGEALRAAEKAKKDDTYLDTLRYRAAAIHDQFDPYFERAAQKDYAFYRSHPQSYVTASTLRYHVSSLPLDTVRMYYNNLGPKMQASGYGKAIAEEIEKLAAGSPGSMAKDFTASELNGSTLQLSALKGKVILIDFWASWCVPCRKSMPHVKELYSQYKEKGLEVIAVSDDDRDSTAWKKALAKDGTDIWHNVLRGLDWDKLRKGEKNDKDISEKFGIHSLPTKIIIDRDGKIVGRYDKGTEEEAVEMDKKLASIFAAG